MKKQMPTLIDFFFIQSFFNWVARVQKLLSISKVRSGYESSECSSTYKEAVVLTETRSNNNSEEEYDDDDDDDDITLVMKRLGLVNEESKDKKLKFDDMSTLFDETEPCLDEVMSAFCVFDQNGDGFIDENEMNRVMCALGFKEGKGLESCRKMIRGYDVNGDGLIDFNEFLKVVEMSFC